MQTVLQLADDVGEVGDGPLLRLQHIHALDSVPQLSFFLEVESVTLSVSFDQYAEEAEQELTFSSVGASENGLIVKSRASWPTFR